jgi:F420-dependent oxidoreductase-like protein
VTEPGSWPAGRGGLRVAVAGSASPAAEAEFVREAERLGADAAWVPELWGYDALTQVGYLAARTSRIALGTSIVQLGSRSPALLATSSMSLQQLTGGRFRLGIGVSGPQVMEGWHGVRFRRPVQLTRETIEIIRMISRGDRLEYQGQSYQLPLPDSQGRPLRPAAPPVWVPIYVAAIGPANLRLCGELADGWLGNAFIPETAEAFLADLRAGAGQAGRTLAGLDLQVPVAVEITDDVDEAVARHAAGYAFTIGAMGSGTTNFYNEAFARQGFGDEVRAVQRLWQDGRRDEAARQVPRAIGAKTNLLGTPAMIRERLRLYRDAGVRTLSVKLRGELPERLATLGQILDLVREINRNNGTFESPAGLLPLAAGSGQSASGATFRIEEVPMDLSVQQFVKILRRAGMPDAAAMAARTLHDPVTARELDQFCAHYGLSRGTLMERMGGSP